MKTNLSGFITVNQYCRNDSIKELLGEQVSDVFKGNIEKRSIKRQIIDYILK